MIAKKSLHSPKFSAHVLVKTDETGNWSTLVDLLQSNGCQVSLTAYPGQKSEIAAQNDVDVVIIDLVKISITDFEMSPCLISRPETPDRSILMILEHKDYQKVLDTPDLEFSDILFRPVNPNELLLRLHNTLTQKRLKGKLANAQICLEQADSIKANWTQLIIHDLRTPIAAMQIALDYLKMTAAPGMDEHQADFLDKAYINCGRLVEMTTTISDTARLEAGTYPIAIQPCSPHEAIVEIVEPLKTAQNFCKISYNPPKRRLGIINCDIGLIRRILAKLLNNANKSSRKKGRVTIASEETENGLRIAITDSGTPIPEESQELIFALVPAPNLKTHRSAVTAKLDLIFCRLAVEAHGGRIGLISKGSRGNTFWFILPREPKSTVV